MQKQHVCNIKQSNDNIVNGIALGCVITQNENVCSCECVFSRKAIFSSLFAHDEEAKREICNEVAVIRKARMQH